MYASQPASSRRFAVFDIDGTLIRWQLYHAVVDELARQGSLRLSATQRIKDARAAWKRRDTTDSFARYEQILLNEYLDALTDISTHTFHAAVNTVIDHYKDQTYTYTRDLTKRLHSEGYRLIAISGSHQELIEKLGVHYGFDLYVGSTYETKEGHYLRQTSTPVHDKGAALRQLVKRHDLTFEGSVGVGDTASDVSMLELVEHPIAFNPNSQLFEHAKAMGWNIVIERKNMIYELESHGHAYVLA